MELAHLYELTVGVSPAVLFMVGWTMNWVNRAPIVDSLMKMGGEVTPSDIVFFATKLVGLWWTAHSPLGCLGPLGLCGLPFA